MDISVIIVNWNSAKLLEQCLFSIALYLDELNYEIIVVDNLSEVKEINYLKKVVQPKFPQARFIYNQQNAGFAKGNNLALKMAKGSYVLLLNPDTLFIDKGFGDLIKLLQNKKIGLVGCKLLNADRTTQISCFRFPRLWRVMAMSFLIHKFLPTSWRRNFVYSPKDLESQQTPDWILGAFMLMPREVIESIGGLDEEIFMYGEDMDLCYRVRALGLDIVYYPEFQIIHYGDASGSQAWSNAKREVMVYKAIFYFYRKHFGRGRLLLARGFYALSALIKLAAYTFSLLKPGPAEKAFHEMRTQWQVLLTQFNLR